MTDNASSREGPSLSKEEAAKASKVAQGNSNSNSSSPDDREIAAASLIQRNYRGYKTRRELQGMGLDAGARWDEAFHHMKLDDAREQQLGKKQGGGESNAEGDLADVGLTHLLPAHLQARATPPIAGREEAS